MPAKKPEPTPEAATEATDATEPQPEPVDPRKLSLGQKILGIMADMGAVEKGGWNVNQKYPFVQEADLVNVVRPLLIKYGVLLHQSLYTLPDGTPYISKSPDGKLTSAIFRMQLVDADTGEVWPETLAPGDGWDQGDKGANKAWTGANKFFHLRQWQIGAGSKEEPEGDEKTDKATAAEEAKAGPRVVQRRTTAGVEKGGKNSSTATKAQVDEIARLAGGLGLTSETFVPVLKAVSGREPKEGETLRQFLGALTGEDAGKLISALMEFKPVDEQSPSTAREDVHSESTDVDEEGARDALTVV